MHVVTGGAGFIGSNIVAALEARGRQVAVIDLPDSEARGTLTGRDTGRIIPPGQALAALDALGAQVDAVIHMGAISDTTVTDVEAMMENNLHFSRRLWDWCTAHQVPFVYASSAATYGDGAAGFDDRDDASYLRQLRPLNLYGESKHLFDLHACANAGKGPPRWAGLKFFNVFGPNETHKGAMRSVAVQLFEQISAGGRARLFASDRPDYPDGGQMRDFVWVGDCADIVLWLLDAPRRNGLYNVGSGKARSFSDLARAVFAAMERPEAIDYVPMPEKLRGRYQYFTEGPMAKLMAAGYPVPMTALEEGVRRYVRHLAARA